jgi:hypothetical protein
MSMANHMNRHMYWAYVFMQFHPQSQSQCRHRSKHQDNSSTSWDYGAT